MTLDYLCVCGYYLKDLPSSKELVAVMKEHRRQHKGREE
jgi:hypothetical protein